MGTWCLFGLSAQFPHSVERVRREASTQFLRGVNPRVTIRSDCLGGWYESWLNWLWETQLEKTSLALPHYFSWHSIESLAAWWSDYQRGVWSSELSTKIAKCVKNRKMHRSSYKNTFTWLGDETTKPYRYTCSTLLTDGVTDKHNTRDWSFIDRDNTCMTLDLTPCASATNAFIANTTIKYKVKTLRITWTWSQAWLRHQHAEIWLQRTRKAYVKTHMSSRSEPECVQSSSETLQGRLQN